MLSNFIRKHFSRPKILAGFLLLAFFAQAVWLLHVELRAGNDPEAPEVERIREGWKQWHGRGIAGAPFAEDATDEQDHSDPFRAVDQGFDTEHSPLLYLVSAGPLMAWPHRIDSETSTYWRYLPRLPFLACGVFLGASLWYVARRLCGNTGGLVALTFYCFSPALIQAAAVWHTEPEITSAWGAFGTIFTAIAVAHTLYAPREVVLWNWRRIVLLGISLAIAIGAQFSMIVLIPMALAFLVYVAPVRQKAGFVIWIASCLAACVLLFACYFFHANTFATSLRRADFWGATWRGFAVFGVYKQVAAQIGRVCPALALALPVTLIAYALWPRARYFGNTAPLLVAAIFMVLGIAHPHTAGAGFLLAAMPFLFIFVAGVLADLMETRYRLIVSAGVFGMMAAYVVWSVVNLANVPTG